MLTEEHKALIWRYINQAQSQIWKRTTTYVGRLALRFSDFEKHANTKLRDLDEAQAANFQSTSNSLAAIQQRLAELERTRPELLFGPLHEHHTRIKALEDSLLTLNAEELHLHHERLHALEQRKWDLLPGALDELETRIQVLEQERSQQFLASIPAQLQKLGDAQSANHKTLRTKIQNLTKRTFLLEHPGTLVTSAYIHELHTRIQVLEQDTTQVDAERAIDNLRSRIGHFEGRTPIQGDEAK